MSINTAESVSEDAAPLPPRNQGQREIHADRHETQAPSVAHEFLDMPMPDPHWHFNSFLLDIAEGINAEEVDKMKNMFIDIIGRGALERVSSATELFDLLRRRTILTKENLLYLQFLLRKLNRQDLIRIAIEYAKKAGNVIYFHQPSGEPLNGYTTVKFHVEGRDFRNCSPGFIQDVRFKVSTLLFIPPQDVVIAGVEPSASMLITVMIPDIYAELLEEMLTDNKSMEQLIELEIDTVKIGSNVYNIRGIDGVELIETEQQLKLVNVYQQLQDKSRQIEKMAEDSTSLLREKRIVESKLDELETESVVLKSMFHRSDDQPASLASQSAFSQFKQCLCDVKMRNYDSALIRKLLQANAVMVSIRKIEETDIKTKQLQLELHDLRSQVIPIRQELEILRLTETGSLEQRLRDSLTQLLQSIAASPQQVEVGQTLTDAGNGILKKLSNSLRSKEKQKLEKKYTWKPNDQLTKYKDSDSSLFLACLFHKEIESTRKLVDFNTFVERCLTDVKRPDLIQKFHEMTSKQQRPSNPRKMSPHEPTAEHVSSSSGKDEQLSRVEDDVHTILEKVNGIDAKLISAQQYGMPRDRSDNFFQAFPNKPFPSGMNFSSPNVSEKTTPR